MLGYHDDCASKTSKCDRDAKGPLGGKINETASLHLGY